MNSAGSSPNEARHVRFAQRTAVSAIAGQPEPDPATLHERITDANFAQPIFYIGNRFNVVGQDAKIEWPDCPRWLDYEGDSGGFIGRKDRNILKERAREHIFGFAVFNDFSARDRQARA